MRCTEEMYEAYKQVVYSPDAQNETMRDLLTKGIEAAIEASGLSEENERLRALVQLGEKLFDQILPQAGKLVIDVGNLNNFLMEAGKL